MRKILIFVIILIISPIQSYSNDRYNFEVLPDTLYTRIIEVTSIDANIIDVGYNQSRFNFTTIAQIWNPNNLAIKSVSEYCTPELQMDWDFDSFDKSLYSGFGMYYITVCTEDEITQTFNPGLTNKTVEGYVTFDLYVNDAENPHTTIDQLPFGDYYFYYPLGSNSNYTTTRLNVQSSVSFLNYLEYIPNWGEILFNNSISSSTTEDGVLNQETTITSETPFIIFPLFFSVIIQILSSRKGKHLV